MIKTLIEILLAFAILLASNMEPLVQYSPFPLLIGMLLVITLGIFLRKRDLKFYGFAKPRKGDFGQAFLCFLLLFPIAFAGRLIAPGFDSWFVGVFGLLEGNLGYFLLTIPIFAIAEELYSRSVLQSNLRGFGIIGMIVISAHFALLHTGGVFTYVVLPSVFLGSLVVCFLYSRTGNIFMPIIVHGAFNSLIIMQTVWHLADPSMEFVFWGAYGLLFLAFLPKMWRLWKIKPNPS